jgi:hypothetical protein
MDIAGDKPCQLESPEEVASFGNVSTGVMADLQAVMLALTKISAMYLDCERCMTEELRMTAMPRKKWRLPMSILVNSEQREVVIRSRRRVEDVVRTMSSMYSKRKVVPSVH